MSPYDPFDDLRTQLVRAAAPVPRRRWSSPRGGLAVILAGLSVAGTATAAIVATREGEPSAPLVGPLPPSPGAPTRDRTYRITVAPDLRAGAIGWCYGEEVRREGRFTSGGMGCGPAWTRAMSIYGGGASKVPGGVLAYAVVPPNVASVEFSGGHRVAPRRDPTLPYDWRIAVLPQPGRALSLRGARVVALDAAGAVLPQSLTAGTYARAAPVRHIAGRASAADRMLERPGRGAPLCAIAGVPASYTTVSAVAATGRGTVPALRDRAFLSCAQTTLRRGGALIRVALLLDAQDPGRAAAPLPRVPGWASRRVGPAWLVITGGATAQRRALLAGLRPRA